MWNWISTNILGVEASWFWSMAQFFAIAISLGLIYRQIKLQRQANMLQKLSSLDNRWRFVEIWGQVLKYK